MAKSWRAIGLNTQIMLTLVICLSAVASTSAYLWIRRPWCLDLVVDVPTDARCAPPYHLERARDGVFTCGCVRIIRRDKSQ